MSGGHSNLSNPTGTPNADKNLVVPTDGETDVHNDSYCDYPDQDGSRSVVLEASNNNYLPIEDLKNASLLYKSLMLISTAISRGEKKTKTLKSLY